ncbi:MAG: acyl-CoA dehydratase activase [Bacteroidota bacterium]|jgi:predicted CoA-substrate-specific enzyme activase|nr:activase [Ignavibacteria bacterium]MCU7514505.1 activase [Ignavibacteria bacterium]MCU7521578.1 activase [Ignavibacteria bacterium]
MSVQKSLGVCVGASTVSAVYLGSDHGEISIVEARTIAHNGNPRKVISGLFEKNSIPAKIAVTGKKFRKFLNLTSISEAEAIETAAAYLGLSGDVIISAGGESFIVYVLDKNNRISKVCTGNKCASGTGEFFLQQIKRMDLDVEDAISLGAKGDPYNISGRCSVFCKSDCTHALNKGVAKENVVSGLAKMMSQKIIELTSRVPHESAIMIGGVSRNKAVMRFLKDYFNNVTVPEEAPYFEALGAAVYAMKNETLEFKRNDLFSEKHSPFTFHRPLSEFTHLVHFKEFNKGILQADDDCILGLDVGSTTTKAVLLRKSDNAIVAGEYLRTNGDPVKASVECYESIKNQLTAPVKITGLGVTGSGRHIAGLHALTKGIINEIIAHAAATIYFDHEVDTIFEIGGQDAKYTYITSGVASDYAMNEACSAGTGSFLEEAAKESLDIDYKEIGEIALKAQNPPNFNDQCAAFISSDVKNALHEGLSKEDIVTGLVYSICMNYNNRVKGNRPVGKKVFMQGGVCYNKAVPVAMAALTGKEIIVPPEPGLMGAFGVALEIKHRLELGLLKEEEFSLDELIQRTVEYGRTFICAGGAEKCDRKCPISMISIDGKKYPFGGACNKYYNVQMNIKESDRGLDLVKLREKLVFEKYLCAPVLDVNAPAVGISRSFLTNTLYPLYYNFFTRMGFRVILAQESKTAGVDKREAAFCYPVELAHGFLQDLLDKNPDYVFLPHIKEIYNPGEDNLPKKTCVLMQSENYYLKAAFKDELKNTRLLDPVLDFSDGYEKAEKEFVKLALGLGKNKKEASDAYRFACGELNKMFSEFKKTGNEVLKSLEEDPEKFAVVIFGRSYNAFARNANLGVPQKFSSRGITVIPHDFLPYDGLESYKHMYWGLGQQILRGARYVYGHPQLFASYITNFSCGPDSFIIPYFRNIMGRKPSLTLELDSHSADAGVNTRIEAALDIIKSFRELNRHEKISAEKSNGFMPLKVLSETKIVDSDGRELSITDPSVNVGVPNMGRLATEAFAAAFRHEGINSFPLPEYNMDTLTTGRGSTTCKECLPLILNAGSLIEYYNSRKNKDEKTLLFMAKGDGPCRLGQYHVYLEDIIKKRKMRNIGVYTLSDENSYEGLGNRFVLRGWAAITIGNLMTEVYNSIQALAADRKAASKIFRQEYDKILDTLEHGAFDDLYRQIELSALKLNAIEKKESIHEAKKVVIVGEIFVRHEEFSRMDLLDRLIEKGFVVRIVPIGEYVYYSNYLAAKEDNGGKSPVGDRLKFTIRDYVQKHVERKIRKILEKSGFIEFDMPDVKDVLKKAEHLVSPELAGEAILTIGSAMREIMDHVSGVISLGPFGCMPSRLAESILNVEMNTIGKLAAEKRKVRTDENDDLPFLAIETDGNIFPQIIQSKIEIFMLQAERLHEKLKSGDRTLSDKYKDAFHRLINNITGNAKPEEPGEIPALISEAE